MSLSSLRHVLHTSWFLLPHLAIPFKPHVQESTTVRLRLRDCLLNSLVLGFTFLMGCSGPMAHYAGVERSLLAGQGAQAIELIEGAKDDYGSTSRLLYLMDHGMVLHLAGEYVKSNTVLEEAHLLIEDLYTKRIRDEAASLLVNEARQPYEGAPYEHVMVNVVKGLNFALLQQWNEALVEARRIDHRLNVLSDEKEGNDTYQEDPFARYLIGLLYDITGDSNNAYVGYRKAAQIYTENVGWTRVVLPDVLKLDLIRTANRLGLPGEAKHYQEEYPDVVNQQGVNNGKNLAQIVVVTYHGKGPRKEDLFIDVPVSLDALALVALSKRGFRGSSRRTRRGEALLYGIHGRIARIALPRFTYSERPQTLGSIEVRSGLTSLKTQSQRVYDIHAVAEKTLADGYDSLVLRAVARTAIKMATAEGIALGARAAVGKKHRDLVGPLVGGLARVFALATEEADIRSWRTLPGEIHLARIWVEPGEYSVSSNSIYAQRQQLQLSAGETRFVLLQALK